MKTFENQTQFSPFSSLQNGNKRSLFERSATTIKVVIVGILTLLLLIPLGMTQSLIRERQSSKRSAVADITSKWGGEQTITGPCLLVPYVETVIENTKTMQIERHLLLLPETLNVRGQTSVETRKRGIYDASVYATDIFFSGAFDATAIEKFNVHPDQINWSKTRVIIGLSDLKGIKETVTMESNGRKIEFESGLPSDNVVLGHGVSSSVSYARSYDDPYSCQLFGAGLNAKLNPKEISTLKEAPLPFSVSLKMNGSQGIYIVPIGKKTALNLQSDWATPKFDGEFLPETRNISYNGFTADWKVLDLNRGYGQVIRTDNENAVNQMAASRFGVRFIQAVDQYQQNMRSVKYAVLIILLTFVVVFFIELLHKKTVNPFHYMLVGLALVLFYALLLSMSEVLGFNLAYLLAAAMTTLLIALHMSGILKNRKQGAIIGILLGFLYAFIFTLIRMESYALLVGSLGLFAILAVIMYFSKKIRY